jgi:predicted GIY-YIG superfamily endonuclease
MDRLTDLKQISGNNGDAGTFKCDADMLLINAPIVYLIKNELGRTYVGCTIRGVSKRLRQHNGEISGGADQTRGRGPWTVVYLVSGFRTRQEALQFEYAWRRVHTHQRPRPPYTMEGRYNSLLCLMGKERWSSKSPLACEVPVFVQQCLHVQSH